MRIGVVSDTHVGEHLDAMPPEVLELLDGVDLILHAGDVSVPRVLDELRGIAPVAAVRGNHDGGPLRRLPLDLVVPVGGVRVGLTHGARKGSTELPSGVASVAAGRPVLLGFARTMVRRFRDVDIVVTGHLHMPLDQEVDGVRLFSPGAVHVPEQIPREGGGLSGWAYRRYRGGLSDDDRRAAIGFIELGPTGLTTRRVVLRRPIVATRRRRTR